MSEFDGRSAARSRSRQTSGPPRGRLRARAARNAGLSQPPSVADACNHCTLAV